MPTKTKDTGTKKNGTVNEQPLFLQNGNHRFAISETEKISNFRQALPQFIAVSIKNILLFVYGMTLGFPTIVIPAIQGGDGREPSDIVLNRDEISWFSSINLICVPLGCLFSGLLTQPIGKRKAMQFVNLPILASWLLFHFSTKPEHLYGALCLSGLGGGLMEAPVLTYVAEITEPKYRGILSALGSTCVITGIFIQFIMGSLTDWRTVAAVSSAFPVISIIALCFVPESPTWLIREQRFHEAIKALQWLRGWVSEHKIEEEFNRLYDELITQPAIDEAKENAEHPPNKCTSRFRMFKKRSFLVPFLLVSYTFFTGHFSGKTPLQTYAVQIFHALKAPINKYHATILLGVAEMIATILCVFLIHFTGKRPLVLISTIGVGICFFGTATYAHYLKVVPGFAVNNVVVNATSIVSKDRIISQDNITQIFANEEKVLLLQQGMDFLGDTVDTTTMVDLELIEDDSLNRTKRDSLDVITLDYLDYNNTLASTTDQYDLNDSVEEMKSTISENFNTDKIKKIPIEDQNHTSSVVVGSNNEAVEDILLEVPKQEKNYLAWIPLILLLGSAFFAHIGIRMIPWILIGEVFPAAVRSTASGLVSGLGYIFGFLANKLFLQMLSTFTMPGTFWIYSVVAITGAIVLYFILPETEGRTLGEIEAHFSKKSSMDLLRKSSKDKVKIRNLNNFQIPIGPVTESKIIQLQQIDFIPKSLGQSNLAYEENNTTHL